MSNETEEPKVANAKEIIDAVLKHVGMRAPTFAKTIGLNYQRIFDLQSGRTKKFNPGVVNLICEHFPDINKNYLYTGEGSLILSQEKPQEDPAPAPAASASPAAVAEFVELSRRLLDLYERIAEKEERAQAKIDELNRRERELLAYERQLMNR